MPRGKTPLSLIADRRKRVPTFARRKQGVMKMASELATLCAVPVAAEKRAEHSHIGYLHDQLAKENGPADLAPPDSALNGMTPERLRELLESIDAKLLATAERREALGSPDTDAAAVESRALAVVPCNGGSFAGYRMDAPGDGNINDGRPSQSIHDGMAQPPYNHEAMYCYNAGTMQPAPAQYDIGGYQLQMPLTGSGYLDMDYGYQMPGDSNADDGMPDLDLDLWGNANPWIPCNAVVPAGYPYMPMGGDCTHSALSAGDDNFLETTVRSNVVDLDGYDTQFSANEFSSATPNSYGIEELHYLSDVADGINFGFQCAQLQLWAN